jgi:hypothetical protein
MDEEIKMLFQMAYLPVAYANQRYNGGDFLSVAIPLVDECRRQKPNDEALIKRACRTMVLTFNDMLNPKMPLDQINEFVEMIYKPGPITRAAAAQIAAQFAAKHREK